MRTKLGYTVSAFVSFLLCAIMLCGAVLPATADDAALPSLNYHNPTMETNETLSAYDLYTALLGRIPTEGEKLYWQTQELSLTYTAFVPESSIDTQYNGDSGVLSVIVSPYTYTAENGALVTWIPELLYLEGESYELTPEDGVYTAQIANCFYSGDFDMQVAYGCEIEIDRSIVEVLRTEAYNKGYSALQQMQKYREQLDVYNKLMDAQNTYDAYVKWEQDYANYLAQKAIYDQLKAAYDSYLIEYNAYQTELNAYNQWQAYFEQEKAYAANEKPYAEYMDYYKVYKAAVDKLAMFESIFKKDSRGWSVYADITGSAVTEVLANQDLLITSGCNEADILLAGRATENLRVLLKGYHDLRSAKGKSEYEKNKALYQYYINNYDALEKNFCDLYRTLKGLYENKIVSQYIAMKEKSSHYRQLVGHLYVISTALDQDGYRNESTWRIDKKKLRDVIEDVHYFPDGDWDPNNTPYPAKEVPYVERIEKPVRPTVAQPTVEPVAPPVVANPGQPPAVVEDPSGTPRPQKPQIIGPKPVRPVFDEAIEVLYQEIEAGTLKEDLEYARATKLKLSCTVERNISIQNLKTVTFYYADGSVYKQEFVHYGDRVKWDVLDRAPTAEYVYEFLGWNYTDGSAVETDSITVTENIGLYPRYRLTKQMYTVTWVLDGQAYPVKLYYGAMPIPELTVDISPRESQYYRYEFSGWDSEVTTVTGDATYTGSMLRIPKKFNVTWVVKNGTESVTEQWEYNQTPVYGGELSLSSSTHIYQFLGWDKTVSPVTRDVTYTALYREIPLALGGIDTVLEVLHQDAEITVLATKPSVSLTQAALLAAEQGKTLTVCWNGALSISLEGEELQSYINIGTPTLILQAVEDDHVAIYQLEYFNVGANASALPRATVRFDYSRDSSRETVFDLLTDNGWERLESAELRVAGGFKARRMYSYSIIPTANEYCNVTQIVKQAIAGEWVSIALDCVYGYKVVGATIVAANGETVTVSELSFQMPSSAVTVSLLVERIVYRVTFLVDGKEWSYAEYYTGDEILLPENPTKTADDGYIYTFIGWGSVPTIAMGEDEELVFEASFTKSQPVTDYATGNNNNVLLTVVLPCVIAAVVLLIAFLILRRIVRKRGGWRLFGVKIGFGIKRFFGKIGNAFKKLFQGLTAAAKRDNSKK